MAGEIRRRIEALEKMMGRSAEYDKGILEGIDALEEVEKELDWKTEQRRLQQALKGTSTRQKGK